MRSAIKKSKVCERLISIHITCTKTIIRGLSNFGKLILIFDRTHSVRQFLRKRHPNVVSTIQSVKNFAKVPQTIQKMFKNFFLTQSKI